MRGHNWDLRAHFAAYEQAAVWDVVHAGDDRLLTVEIETLSKEIADAYQIEPPAIDRVTRSKLYATTMDVSREPGRDTYAVDEVPASGVDLKIRFAGDWDVVESARRGGSITGVVHISARDKMLEFPCVAESLTAAEANRLLDESLARCTEEIAAVAGQVNEFDESLRNKVLAGLQEAKSRAEERRDTAADLKYPEE